MAPAVCTREEEGALQVVSQEQPETFRFQEEHSCLAVHAVVVQCFRGEDVNTERIFREPLRASTTTCPTNLCSSLSLMPFTVKGQFLQ